MWWLKNQTKQIISNSFKNAHICNILTGVTRISYRLHSTVDASSPPDSFVVFSNTGRAIIIYNYTRQIFEFFILHIFILFSHLSRHNNEHKEQ